MFVYTSVSDLETGFKSELILTQQSVFPFVVFPRSLGFGGAEHLLAAQIKAAFGLLPLPQILHAKLLALTSRCTRTCIRKSPVTSPSSVTSARSQCNAKDILFRCSTTASSQGLHMCARAEVG